MTEPGGRWKLDVRPRAQCQLSRLSEKIATAAAEFIVGPLPDNPYRVGHPLRDEYAGQHSARRARTGRFGTGSAKRLTLSSCSTSLADRSPTDVTRMCAADLRVYKLTAGRRPGSARC